MGDVTLPSWLPMMAKVSFCPSCVENILLYPESSNYYPLYVGSQVYHGCNSHSLYFYRKAEVLPVVLLHRFPRIFPSLCLSCFKIPLYSSCSSCHLPASLFSFVSSTFRPASGLCPPLIPTLSSYVFPLFARLFAYLRFPSQAYLTPTACRQ